MRVNRYFTDRGICSRREADRWVEAGRVTINGVLATHGDQVEDGDVVAVDGADLAEKKKRPVILAYHKPVGIECTADPRVEHNIIAAVNYPERVFHVGRLDLMSEGLILLTNIGDIVNLILRRRYGHEKEYLITLDGPIHEHDLRALSEGIVLEDGRTGPCQVSRLGGRRRIRMVLTEGRNRQIRRMVEALGFRVVRLTRVRIMDIELGDLPCGRWRELTRAETQQLTRLLDQV
jgi:23S rRNA pseudouridine2604 synthase